MQIPSPLMTVEVLQGRLGEKKLRILDCRFDLQDPQAGRFDYERAHVPGAVYADLDRDLSATVQPGTGRHPLPEPEQLARTFGAMGIGPDTGVVVYDDCMGALAARAWWLLRWLGHEQVALLEGGWSRWRALRAPVEAGTVSVASRQLTAAANACLVLETAEIAVAVGEGTQLRLIDARDELRFRGVTEPLDKVAGHIPGTANLPYTACLADDGTWKGSEELRALFHDVLGGDLEAPWSVMCGSGVTACHLAISARLAGLREPRVYVGSWSEWIADPARPIVAEGE